MIKIPKKMGMFYIKRCQNCAKIRGDIKSNSYLLEDD